MNEYDSKQEKNKHTQKSKNFSFGLKHGQNSWLFQSIQFRRKTQCHCFDFGWIIGKLFGFCNYSLDSIKAHILLLVIIIFDCCQSTHGIWYFSLIVVCNRMVVRNRCSSCISIEQWFTQSITYLRNNWNYRIDNVSKSISKIYLYTTSNHTNPPKKKGQLSNK